MFISNMKMIVDKIRKNEGFFLVSKYLGARFPLFHTKVPFLKTLSLFNFSAESSDKNTLIILEGMYL